MTDRAAPKAKKAKAQKGKQLPGPKLVAGDITPGIGHNFNNGEKHPEAIKRMEEIIALETQKKSITKSIGTLRNSLRTEFGILASSVARELALRKLDPDVRVQVETNHEDFKKMLGYQPSLEFVDGKATSASAKAQPSEHNLRQTEPVRTGAPTHAAKGFDVDEDDEDNNDSIITREG